MKDLWKLFCECKMEMESIGMDISMNISGIAVNKRLSRALGRCMKKGFSYRIEINDCMLADEVEVNATKNVIMHELLHTCPGCFNHGGEWKYRASIVNRKLGYHVNRTEDCEALEAVGVVIKKKSAKYALVCNECGHKYERQRWSNALANPSRFRCGICHGSLKTISLDGSAICSPIWSI